MTTEAAEVAVTNGASFTQYRITGTLRAVFNAIETIFKQWLGPLGRPSALLAAMYVLNAIPQ